MKHAPRFLAAAAALLMTLSMAACGTDAPSSQESSSTPSTTAAPQPYALYKAAVDKQAAMTACHALMDVKVTVQMPGMTTDTTVSADMKMMTENGQPKANVAMNLTMLGSEQKYDAYLEGDTVYLSMDMQGETVKYKMSQTEAAETGSMPTEMSFPELTEESLKNAVVTTVNGTTTITGTLPASTLKTVMEDLLKQFGEDPTENADEGEDIVPVFSDMELAVCIDKDGNMTECSYKFDFSVTADGTETKTVLDVTIKIPDPAETVTVTAPADLDSYADFSEIMGSGDDPDPQMIAYEILSVLYDENGERVENYDEQYQRFVLAYGEDVVEEAMQYVQQIMEQVE